MLVDPNLTKLCLKCSEEFNTKSDLKSHMKSGHETVGEYQCENCDKVYTNLKCLKNIVEEK